MATVSSLYVKILGDSTGLQTALAKSSASLKGFGTAASSTSAQASRSVVGMGAAFVGLALAVKAAADFTKFETTMVRTITLGGLTEDQMQRTSAEILDVAVALGKGPQELAEALYFTVSAGIDAADAMDVVTVAAKASAIGLGDTQTVADTLTSVLNAYGTENITAARAADILTTAVREGKGEADAIAGAIGRVIPIASEMGVSFEQVAAGIAAMTRTGLDADEAVTALRGTLSAMLNPTAQAAELLDSVGLSTDALRASIADKGLLGTLTDLQQRFEGNEEAFGTLFGNIRAQTGVLSLLGNNAGEVAQVFRDVAASGGTVEEAFARVQETAEFKLQQALAAVQVVLIKVGGAIAPVITGLASLVEKAGPAIPIILALVAALAGFSIVRSITTWLLAASPAMLAFGAAAAGVAAAVVLVSQAMDSASVSFDKLSQDTGISLETITALDAKLGAMTWDVSIASLKDFGATLDGTNDNVREISTALAPFQSGFESLGLSADQSSTILARFASEMEDMSQGAIAETQVKLQQAQDTVERYGQALGANETPISSFREAMGKLGFTTQETTVLANEALDSFGKELTHTGTVVKKFAGLSTDEMTVFRESVITDFREISTVAGVTEGNFKNALTAMTNAMKLMAGDMVKLAGEVNRGAIPQEFVTFLQTAGPGAVHDFVNANRAGKDAMIETWRKLGGFTKTFDSALNASTTRVDDLRGSLDRLNGTHVTASVTIEEFIQRREGPRRGHSGGQILHDGGIAKRLHSGGQRLAGDEVPAILQRGEFVIRRSAVATIGVGALEAINRLHEGGTATGLGILERLSDTSPMRPAPAVPNITVAVAPPAPRPTNVKLEVDRRRFTRSLDYDAIADGYW